MRKKQYNTLPVLQGFDVGNRTGQGAADTNKILFCHQWLNGRFLTKMLVGSMVSIKSSLLAQLVGLRCSMVNMLDVYSTVPVIFF